MLLPVSTVVFYLQQGLFSKSSLKWLCLSSLLLYELKKTKQQNKKPNPNNYKYKDSHTPDAACVTHKPHNILLKSLFYLELYIVQETEKWQSWTGMLPAPGWPTVRCFLKNQGVTVTWHRTAKPITASAYTAHEVPRGTQKRTGVNTDGLKSNYKDQNRRSQHATYIAHKLSFFLKKKG